MNLEELSRWEVIEIEWSDSTQDGDWKPLEEALKWPENGCFTVGYYIQHNDKTIMVATSYFPEDDPTVGGVWTIPRATIKSLRRQQPHTHPTH